jgi:hypothetical protein
MRDREYEEELLAWARWRDERAARELADYTPVEQQLDLVAQHAELWRDMVEMIERVAGSGPDFLAIPARALLERVRAL